MTELQKEAYGPLGDSSRHRAFEELEAGLRALPESPKDVDLLVLIVRRRPDGALTDPAEADARGEANAPTCAAVRGPPDARVLGNRSASSLGGSAPCDVGVTHAPRLCWRAPVRSRCVDASPCPSRSGGMLARSAVTQAAIERHVAQ
jgi:hypothetical protein